MLRYKAKSGAVDLIERRKLLFIDPRACFRIDMLKARRTCLALLWCEYAALFGASTHLLGVRRKDLRWLRSRRGAARDEHDRREPHQCFPSTEHVVIW